MARYGLVARKKSGSQNTSGTKPESNPEQIRNKSGPTKSGTNPKSGTDPEQTKPEHIRNRSGTLNKSNPENMRNKTGTEPKPEQPEQIRNKTGTNPEQNQNESETNRKPEQILNKSRICSSFVPDLFQILCPISSGFIPDLFRICSGFCSGFVPVLTCSGFLPGFVPDLFQICSGFAQGLVPALFRICSRFVLDLFSVAVVPGLIPVLVLICSRFVPDLFRCCSGSGFLFWSCSGIDPDLFPGLFRCCLFWFCSGFILDFVPDLFRICFGFVLCSGCVPVLFRICSGFLLLSFDKSLLCARPIEITSTGRSLSRHRPPRQMLSDSQRVVDKNANAFRREGTSTRNYIHP